MSLILSLRGRLVIHTFYHFEHLTCWGNFQGYILQSNYLDALASVIQHELETSTGRCVAATRGVPHRAELGDIPLAALGIFHGFALSPRVVMNVSIERKGSL